MHNSLPQLVIVLALTCLGTFALLSGGPDHQWISESSQAPGIENSLDQVLNQKETVLGNPAKLETNQRESITFILGEDGETENFYYTRAMEYFRHDRDARTEYLETDCRSLQAVRDHLEAHPPHGGGAWGRINLVVHSNAWSNLGVPVLPGGKRANTTALLAAMDAGQFSPLPDYLLDENSEIFIHGCGLGNDEGFLEAISLAFGGEKDGSRPKVRSPKYFVTYAAQTSFGNPSQTEKYYSKPFYAFYKTGFHPGNPVLAREFQEKYPREPIQWHSALSRTAPRFLGDSYTHTFRIPVVFIATYPNKEERPALKSEEEKMAWIAAQPELQEKIEEVGIDPAFFQWTVQRIPYETEEGHKVAAVKAIGLCEVACVLQAITEEDPAAPGQLRALQPRPDDQKYFGWSN
ncbi:MAG: hypothetical protein H6581_04435 [Bacteroidia bacterium]|nr:hypothetical protein [Bacteroidia bacterium]